METTVKITIDNITKEKADAIRAALEPDNVDFPSGLSFEIENLDNALVFNFHSTGNMKTLTATIDEVLAHVSMALRVMG
ncbi:KEOPS complex subunit Pcc1 [Candidatus Nitrosotenuis aquarius]|uniref:KEOPS complex subunit Pcc1 n=1 Tax=Candidatus Nitrosotenuis aquarius TaxID=1846278 RepID=UPI000C1EA2E9|nr:KEOPS complex subunit Pcc1 [Candidatus Nitrosotenuis aquarius]